LIEKFPTVWEKSQKIPGGIFSGMLSPRGQCGLEAKFFGLGLGLGLVVSGLGLVLGLTGFGLGLTEVGLVAS